MARVKVDPIAKPATVRLSGALNLKTIGAAHGRLLKALTTHPDVTASVKTPVDVDLTLVQLLDSARRMAEAAGGSFRLAQPADGGLLEILRRGGFLETTPQRAFWLHTKEVC
jgi:hypothetical protein